MGHPAGRLLLQVLPAVEQQLGIQASVQIPQSVSLVSFGFVGSPPQGGWLLSIRSDSVRLKLPVRAPYFRHVLPLVVGFPHLRVLGVIRHPLRLRWAFPVTVCLHLPAPCSTATRRFQHCSVSGFPLLCLKSGRPYTVVFHGQERLGPPKFFAVSLPACHGLRTPAALSILASERMVLCCLRCALKPSASATSAFSKLYQHFRVRGHPCGLQDTLSTLRPSCAPCLHDSAMDARLDTGGWRILIRQGLSPCQRRQAFLGATTLRLRRG